MKVLRDAARQAGKQTEVRINKAGCFSQCGHGPMIVVYPEDVWYAGVQESDLQEILSSHIVGGKPVERLRYAPGVPGANKIDVEKKATHEAPKAAAAPAWKLICRTGDVPATGMKQFSVDGTDIIIVNTGASAHRTDAEYFAYQSLCPHEAVPIEAGICDGSVLTCLEHLWQFDVRTGAPMGDTTMGLKGYPLKNERGELYVQLG